MADTELLCMAKNIYYEARGECLECRYAVGRVVLNRVNDARWGDNICEVIYQPAQFSWTADTNRKLDYADAWEDSKHIARDLIDNDAFSHFDALYFHSGGAPEWAKRVKFYKQKDNHIFYTD